MNIGIIGYGNIGELLTLNILNLNEDYKLFISNKTHSKIDKFENNDDVVICSSNKEVTLNCDKIIIAVKSPQLIDVIAEINPYLKEKAFIIHTCAGIGFDEISKVYDKPVTCVIPSIASSICENKDKKGVSLIYNNVNLSSVNKIFVKDLFSKFSIVKEVKNQKELELFTVITSCMPAFVALNIKSFVDFMALNYDLDKNELFDLLSETVTSSSNLLSSNIFTADELMGKVATKKGITQKGLDLLDDELPEIYENLLNALLK